MITMLDEVISLCKADGATHTLELPRGSFIAYRPAKTMPGSFASRYFVFTGKAYLSEPTWVLCERIHADAEEI